MMAISFPLCQVENSQWISIYAQERGKTKAAYPPSKYFIFSPFITIDLLFGATILYNPAFYLQWGIKVKQSEHTAFTAAKTTSKAARLCSPSLC